MWNRKLSNVTSWITLTILLVLIILYLYTVIQSNSQYKSIMSDHLPTITKNELDSYLNDNPDVIIYYSPTDDLSNKKIEKDFKDYLKSVELKYDVILLAMESYSEEDYVNFSSRVKDLDIDFKPLIKQENIFVINNRVIEDALYKKSSKIKINDIKKFLKEYEVNSDD